MTQPIKKDFNRTQQKRKPDITALVFGKVPPQAVEMEEAVLAACMLEREVFEQVAEVLPSEECFYVDAHQKIYAAMRSLHIKGTPVDLLTITNELRTENNLELRDVPAGYLLIVWESFYNSRPSDDYPLSLYIHDKLDKLKRRRDKEREIKALGGEI